MYESSPIDPKSRYYGNPTAERAQNLAKLEDELTRLRVKERAHAVGPKPEQPPIAENEIVIASEPFPTQFDAELNRVTCQLAYRIKGPAYETINALQGNVTSTALYMVQPGKDSWIVNLHCLSQ